ncbi:MAG: MFS transporter [Acidimicrobiales bacterium]
MSSPRGIGPPSARVLVAACVGYGMVTLDTTVVNVALPSTSHALQTTTTGLEWVLDGYSLSFAVFLLSAGALSDRRGAKEVFLAGLVLFPMASLACGLAPTITVLVAARLIQGLGAAVAVPASLALLQAAYPEPASRARAIGLWGAMAGVAAAAGPALGGVTVGTLGWRAVFFINLPLGAAGLALGARHLPRPPRRPHSLDLAGQLAAVSCVAGLATALIEAGGRGWTSAVVVAAGAVFVAVEHRSRGPMLPLGLFASATISAATVVGLLCNLGFFGELFVMSLYLQQVRGLLPLVTGLLLVPQMAATIVGSMTSGRVMARRGPRLPMLVGLCLGAAGLGGLAATDQHAPYLLLLPCFVAAGFGISFAMMPATCGCRKPVWAAQATIRYSWMRPPR